MKARLIPDSPSCNQVSSSGSASVPFDRQESGAGSEGPLLEETPPPEPSTSAAGCRAAPHVSHRPTGKTLLIGILIAFLGFTMFAVWSTFLRYSAHGVITGRVVDVTSPWPANVEAVYVRAGDTVRQGDVLALVSDPDLEMAIELRGDEMRSAQAELDAQIAVLTVAAHNSPCCLCTVYDECSARVVAFVQAASPLGVGSDYFRVSQARRHGKLPKSKLSLQQPVGVA